MPAISAYDVKIPACLLLTESQHRWLDRSDLLLAVLDARNAPFQGKMNENGDVITPPFMSVFCPWILVKNVCTRVRSASGTFLSLSHPCSL